MIGLHGYFQLEGFIDEALGGSSMAMPLYTDPSRPNSVKEYFGAICNSEGTIERFERLGNDLSNWPRIRNLTGAGQRLYKVGDAACYCLTLDNGQLVWSAGWVEFSRRALSMGKEALLRQNPLIGLGLSVAVGSNEEALHFALGTLLNLRAFSPMLMKKWKSSTEFPQSIRADIESIYLRVLDEGSYLGSDLPVALSTPQRVGVFSNVTSHFPLGIYEFDGRPFHFERIPPSDPYEEFPDFGFIVAKSYSFLRGQSYGASVVPTKTLKIASISGRVDLENRTYLKNRGIEHLISDTEPDFFHRIVDIIIGK